MNERYGIIKKITSYTILMFILLPLVFVAYQGALSGLPLIHLLNMRRLVLLLKSVCLGSLVALSSVAVGIFFLMLMAGRKYKHGYFLAALLLTFYMVSPYIHALSWLEIFNVGKYAFIKTCIVLSMYYLPLNIIVLALGLNSIDNEYVKMGRIYKKDDIVLFRIVLKMLKPYILSAMSLVFLLSLADFSVPSLFQLKTYSFEIFTAYSSGGSFGEVFVLSLPLIAVNLSAFIVLWVNSEKMSYEFKGSSVLKNFDFKLGLINRLFQFLSLILVVILMLVMVFNISKIININFLFDTVKDNTSEFLYSLYISSISAVISVILVFTLIRLQDSILSRLVIFSPMLLSGSIIGISMIGLFIKGDNYGYLLNNSILLLYSTIVKSIPIIYLVLRGSLDTMDNNLLRCGRVYQNNFFHRIIRIEIPLWGLHFAGAFFFGFSYAMGEISSSILLIPPGKQLVSLKIYSYLHYGSGSRISALGFIIILFFSLVTSLFIFITSRRRRYIR